MPTIDEAMQYAKQHGLTVQTAHAILSRQYLIAEIEAIARLTYSGQTQRQSESKS